MTRKEALNLLSEHTYFSEDLGITFIDANIVNSIVETIFEQKTCTNCKHFKDDDNFFGGKCTLKNVNMESDDGCLKGWEAKDTTYPVKTKSKPINSLKEAKDVIKKTTNI